MPINTKKIHTTKLVDKLETATQMATEHWMLK